MPLFWGVGSQRVPCEGMGLKGNRHGGGRDARESSSCRREAAEREFVGEREEVRGGCGR